MFKTDRPRDLYALFRDGVLQDFILHDKTVIDLFKFVPNRHHLGRLEALTLMRKMASAMAREFPGGVKAHKQNLHITPDFLVFARTHFSMESTAEEAAKAWLAIKEIV